MVVSRLTCVRVQASFVTIYSPTFFLGAPADALASVEQHLGVRLPDSLSSLLTETNGALVTFGTHLVWSTDEIVRRNRKMQVLQFARINGHSVPPD
jgi:hypothetical protein